MTEVASLVLYAGNPTATAAGGRDRAGVASSDT